jgi:tetratricopeptide (TPR) repeat protein
VLEDDGNPVGTCFQVAPRVLVTAWHVLDAVGAGFEDAEVAVAPLAGGEPFDAAVARVDPPRDLAVLRSQAALPAMTGLLALTDQVRLGSDVTVTGYAAPADPESSHTVSAASGEWAGGTTREDSTPLGRMTSSTVVPGMSGAPVIRADDHAVVGVVSGRYNTADGWPAGTAWVARTEDLTELLHGIATIQIDVHDLLQARDHLLEAGDFEDAARITERAVAQLDQGGAWEQAAALIHDTLARLPAGSSRQAALNHRLGLLAHNRGDYDEAARLYQRSLEINEQAGNEADIAGNLHQLGMLAENQGDYAEATRQYQRALEINERLGNQPGMASGYHQLGLLAYRRGDYDEAARQCQHSLDIDERLGNQAGVATSHHALGILASRLGHHDDAASRYQRALGIRERLGDQAGLADSYHELGILAQQQGDYDEAARQYQRALDINQRLGNQVGMASTYGQLGALASARGDYGEAIRQVTRTLDIRERLGDQVGIARSCHNLGVLETGRGGPAAAAITWHVRALVIRLQLGVPEAANDLSCLAAYRGELGARRFRKILTGAAGHRDLAESITSLLDQVD